MTKGSEIFAKVIFCVTLCAYDELDSGIFGYKRINDTDELRGVEAHRVIESRNDYFICFFECIWDYI